MLLICCRVYIFFFKQKTAYEMRIIDWSSDVCSSDLNNFSSDPGNNVAVLVHSTRSRPSIAAHRIGCGDCASRGRRGDKLMTAAVRRWGRATCYDANMAIVCLPQFDFGSGPSGTGQ